MAKKSLLLLNRIQSFSFKKLERIVDYFRDPDEIFHARRHDLLRAGLSSQDTDTIFSLRASREVDEELGHIEEGGITAIDVFETEYPSLLRQIPSPPLILYLRGAKDLLHKMCFAIVGSRLATLYGSSMAEWYAHRLSCLGLVIVSGLARGIDAAAHRGALKGGSTIAVLGSGLGTMYPRENQALAEHIAASGLLLSEFPFTMPPLRENFPRRNRIISGLARGVLVVEAQAKSGALITAHCALEQNREVFALPGKADSPFSKGAHLLIKEGAKLVDTVEDILGELTIRWSCIQDGVHLGSEERKVFDIITGDGLFLEEISIKSGLERGLMGKAILNLQVKGLIEEKRPLYFSRKVYG